MEAILLRPCGRIPVFGRTEKTDWKVRSTALTIVHLQSVSGLIRSVSVGSSRIESDSLGRIHVVVAAHHPRPLPNVWGEGIVFLSNRIAGRRSGSAGILPARRGALHSPRRRSFEDTTMRSASASATAGGHDARAPKVLPRFSHCFHAVSISSLRPLTLTLSPSDGERECGLRNAITK